MRKTKGILGVVETLFATSVCGCLFSLTAGQPLIIIGTTGPIIVFEQVVYEVRYFPLTSNLDLVHHLVNSQSTLLSYC